MGADDLSERLVDSINASYGAHPGFRAAHARGVLCAGRFAAAPAAAGLSRAAHLDGSEVRTHVRFSNGSGNPTVADTIRDGRGIAVKFYLPDGTTTDIVGLSLPLFFVRTPEELLEFNDARRPDPATGQPDMAKVGAFLGAHPEALPAVEAAMLHPIPASYCGLTYHSIHAFGFESADGATCHGRYHLVPDGGDEHLTDDEVEGRADDFLRAELEERFERGPAAFSLRVELANPDDPLDDPTAPWAEEHEVVELGRLELTSLAFDREQGDDILVMDPTRVTDGIRLTDDPILHARSGAYRVSVARRTGG